MGENREPFDDRILDYAEDGLHNLQSLKKKVLMVFGEPCNREKNFNCPGSNEWWD